MPPPVSLVGAAVEKERRRGSVSTRTSWVMSGRLGGWFPKRLGGVPPGAGAPRRIPAGNGIPRRGKEGCALPRSVCLSGRIPLRGSPLRPATGHSSVLVGPSCPRCPAVFPAPPGGGAGSSPSGYPGMWPRGFNGPHGRSGGIPGVATGSVPVRRSPRLGVAVRVGNGSSILLRSLGAFPERSG